MPLFEVAVIEKKDDTLDITFSDGAGVAAKKRERLLLAPRSVLAPDAEAAKARVLLDCKDDLGDYDEDLLEVLCRPFFE